MMGQIIVPNDYDVLMGQSPNLRLHPGNKRLKELVARNFEEYFNKRTSKLDKTFIAKGIIQDVIEHGGRFLKQPEKKRVGTIKDSLWVVEDDPVRIRDKVASQFRGHLKELKRRKSSDDGSASSHTSPNEKPSFATFFKEDQIERRQETVTSPTEEVLHRGPLKKRKIKLDYNEDASSFRDEAEFQKVYQHLQSQHKNIKIETVETERNNFPMYIQSETGTKVPQSGERAQDELLNRLHLDIVRNKGRLPPQYREKEFVENTATNADIIASTVASVSPKAENVRSYYDYGNYHPSTQRAPLVNVNLPLDVLMRLLQT